MNTARISAVIPARRMTEKAIRVTPHTLDGEDFRADTTWLPRSICTELTIRECDEGDGYKYLEVTATVPMWWVRKLDTRAAWQHAGHKCPPSPTRPW